MGTWAYPVLRPEQVQQPDVLGQLGKVVALRQAMAMEPIREQAAKLELQQQQYQWESTQAVNDAFRQSYNVDPSTGVPQFNQDNLTSALAQSGHGAAIPGIVKSFTDMQQSLATLQKTKNDVALQEQNAIGQLGFAAHQAKDDPNVLINGLIAVSKQYPQVQPYIQALQQDPSRAPQLIQWMMNQSPNVQKQLVEAWKPVEGGLQNTITGQVLGGAQIPLPPEIARAVGIPQSANAMMPAKMVKDITDAAAAGKEVTNFGGNAYILDKATNKTTYLGPSTPMTMVTTMYGTPGAVPTGTTVPPGSATLPSGGVVMPQPPPGGTAGGAPGQPPPAAQQTPTTTTPSGAQTPTSTTGAQPIVPSTENAQTAQAAVADVPLQFRAAAIKDAVAAGSVYQKAVQSNADMQTFINLARQGNIIGYNYVPIQGVLDINTKAGSVRINQKELQAYGSMPLLDRVLGWFGKNTTGASIPDSVLSDMQAAHAALAENAKAGYQNQLDVYNKNYGSNFQPVPMREQGATGAPAGGTPGAPLQQRPPGGGAQLRGPVQPGERVQYSRDGRSVVLRGGQWVDPTTGLPPTR